MLKLVLIAGLEQEQVLSLAKVVAAGVEAAQVDQQLAMAKALPDEFGHSNRSLQ